MKPTDIKDPEYFHKVVDCQYACPAHTPVPEYIRLIGEGKYTEAYKQLSTGNDNLVLQATKLKSLGLKTKKELPKEIVNTAIGNELPEQTDE